MKRSASDVGSWYPGLRGNKREKYMNAKAARKSFAVGSAAILAGALLASGCNNKKEFPDEKSSVTNSLNGGNLSAVSVSQDRDKGVMTLTGNLDSPDQKAQAETLAKQAAPDYTIADEIGVRPSGDSNAGSVASKRDSAIEDNFKAMLKEHKALDDQSIHCSAKNGTLELTGSVKTAAQRHEAEALAKKIQNVQQVVNEIEVKPGKHSTARS
jgi:hyperosmotically inducible periplasmic protein